MNKTTKLNRFFKMFNLEYILFGTYTGWWQLIVECQFVQNSKFHAKLLLHIFFSVLFLHYLKKNSFFATLSEMNIEIFNPPVIS